MTEPDSRPAPRPLVTVLGSINMDLVVRCAFLPLPGQTISARSLAEVPGGKGANQAVAAARSGGRVRMIGRVGDDSFGAKLRSNLIDESIDCAQVASVPGCESGIAIVEVEDSGENAILVVPGANAQIQPDEVDAVADLIRESDVLMVQLECPIDSVLRAVGIARESGVRVILDPAPAMPLPDALFDVDLICPNESEAAEIVGTRLRSADDAESIARDLFARGPDAVALTLGSQGTLLFDGSTMRRIPSIPVQTVDTTAAGDAFAGALAVRWAESGSLVDSIHFANCAGALAASKSGAQPSLPDRAKIESALASQTPS